MATIQREREEAAFHREVPRLQRPLEKLSNTIGCPSLSRSSATGRAFRKSVPYTLPKLTDFSPASLDKAVQDLLSALESESQFVSTENAWKNSATAGSPAKTASSPKPATG